MLAQPTSAQPIVPTPSPIRAWMAAIPRKYLYAAGGFFGLLILIATFAGGEDEEPSTPTPDEETTVVADNKAPEPEPTPATTGIDEDTLIAIDVALTSKNEDEALTLIRPARDKFPNDPQLLWREGKALSLKKTKSSRVTALERYGQALDQDPKLIDNPDFYGELNQLLRNSSLRDHAIDLSVQKLGPAGHKFLLELVNVDDPRQILPWIDRHRVLDVLNADPEASKLVDNRLNIARDLYQAGEAPKPCTEFGRALDQVATSRDVYYLEHVMQDKLVPPEPKAEDPEDAATCEAMAAKLTVVRDLLAAAHPDEAAKYTVASKPPSKKKKKR